MSDLPHIPVLQSEVLSLFEALKIKTFVDGTLGAGGHAEALLKAHPEIETYIGIDQDPTARALAEERLAPFKEKLQVFAGNFRQIKEAVGDRPVDGILLDLGVSSMQLDQAEKGFSFSKEAMLDMRMDPSGPLTAKEIVNQWTEAELLRIFSEYGEVPNSRTIARVIVAERDRTEIVTTTQLGEILKPHLRRRRGQKINPLTLIFQALRMAVNDEIGVLEQVIPDSISMLRPGGRLAIITFHSIEDRCVKTSFRFESADWEEDPSNPMTGRKPKEASALLLTRKPITPSREEEKENVRCRSAKMRAVESL